MPCSSSFRVELYLRTPAIRGTGCDVLGLAPPSSGLQFSLQTILLTSHQPPLSLHFSPFPTKTLSLPLAANYPSPRAVNPALDTYSLYGFTVSFAML